MNLFTKLPLFYLIILFFYFDSSFAKCQTYKYIDKFEQDNYYLSFLDGTGTITDKIINNQGLKINYHFDKGSSYSFTILHNYDRYVQDFSFMPLGFSLTIKGGNTSDRICLRLWEDNDFDRLFDQTDELYTSNFYILGKSVHKTVVFPIDSFKKVAGDGNHKLDLNRIRAWDIEIKSQTNKKHSGELYITDLKFICNYKPQYSENAKLSGTFVTLFNDDPTKNSFWTQDRWNEELLRMKNMNLTKLIIQYSVYQNISWYTPCKISYITYYENTINKIFSAAERVGIKVYIGLAYSESWNGSDKASKSTYDDLLITDKKNIDELYAIFGSSENFGGWYIPQEINDFDWPKENKKRLLFQWLQQIAEYAHKKDVSKPVIISPFFNLWQPADLLETWYDDLLDVAKDIDWVYPQDGVGTSLKKVDVDIPNYCNHIKAACERHGKKFGITVESFRQLSGWPVDNGKFSAISTDIEQMKEQIQEAYQLNPNDIILYNWDYLLKKDR